MLDISACQGRTQYTAKDAAKAIIASKYIGRGSPKSSTNAYAAVIEQTRVNGGKYGPLDIVWISAEGNRRGRIDPDFAEIGKACDARAWIITDTPTHRTRSYNIGERQVAEYLVSQDYIETRAGCWSHPEQNKKMRMQEERFQTGSK